MMISNGLVLSDEMITACVTDPSLPCIQSYLMRLNNFTISILSPTQKRRLILAEGKGSADLLRATFYKVHSVYRSVHHDATFWTRSLTT